MKSRAIILTIATVAAFASIQKAAAQSITVTPANSAIAVGHTQPFTSPEVSNAATIEAGDYHACIALENGEARCSGFNSSGQLGNGTTTNSSSPVTVVSLSDTATVSSGGFHSCAALRNGGVACWGNNEFGQLGDGTTTYSATPVSVSGITNAIAVAAGYHHSCAALQDGTVRCWGDNSYGELGDGATIDHNFPRGGQSYLHSSVPVMVSGITNAVGVTASDGYHSCAVLQDGTVRCWGDNSNGQLGDGTRTRSSLPVTPAGIANARAISSGDFHTCALLQDGGISCWGLNFSGQLGDGTGQDSTTPVFVSSIDTAVSVSVGVIHTCAVLQDGSARCWGNNDAGEIGDGTTADRFVPAIVSGISGATGPVAAGNNDSCVVIRGGIVKCWGMNTYGELGIGNTSDQHAPVTVVGINATWTSSDSSVATIDATGVATGVSAGSATITAAFKGSTGTATVIVVGRPTLTLTRNGTGIVTSSPSGIDCGTTCSAFFDVDTVVTLTAAPGAGFSLMGWSGCDSASGTTCVTTMSSARSISVTFSSLTLTLTKSGNGRGSVRSSEPGIDCGPETSSCMASFGNGTALSLAASPADGSQFNAWSGCDSTSGSFCAITIDASKAVVANFTLRQFVLSVQKPGIGNGTVTAAGGINCGSTCSASYDYGTAVTLTATPALGSAFLGWTGCDAASGATCTVAIREATSIAANFVGVPLP